MEAFRSAVSVYRINYGGDCSDKGGNEVFGSISLGRIHVALGNIIWNKKRDAVAALYEYELAESEYRALGLVNTSKELHELLQKIDEIKECYNV